MYYKYLHFCPNSTSHNHLPDLPNASLIKTLEEIGVGRPSTYAPTLTTIQARNYVIKEAKNLYPTELGEVVNDIMKKYFPILWILILQQIWKNA